MKANIMVEIPFHDPSFTARPRMRRDSIDNIRALGNAHWDLDTGSAVDVELRSTAHRAERPAPIPGNGSWNSGTNKGGSMGMGRQSAVRNVGGDSDSLVGKGAYMERRPNLRQLARDSYSAHTVQFGRPGSLKFRMMFLEFGRETSPWHTIPLEGGGEGLLNCICKTPAGSWVRYELAQDEPFNPLRVLKARNSRPARYAENCPWNVGVLPQTYTDPKQLKAQLNLSFKALYESGPVEVLEIGESVTRKTGEVYLVRPLAGVLLLEAGTTMCWKIVAIAVDDPLADSLQTAKDLAALLPDTLLEIREWLRKCLSPKPGVGESTFPLGYHPTDVIAAANAVATAHSTWKRQLSTKPSPSSPLPLGTPLDPLALEKAWQPMTGKLSADSIPLQAPDTCPASTDGGQPPEVPTGDNGFKFGEVGGKPAVVQPLGRKLSLELPRGGTSEQAPPVVVRRGLGKFFRGSKQTLPAGKPEISPVAESIRSQTPSPASPFTSWSPISSASPTSPRHYYSKSTTFPAASPDKPPPPEYAVQRVRKSPQSLSPAMQAAAPQQQQPMQQQQGGSGLRKVMGWGRKSTANVVTVPAQPDGQVLQNPLPNQSATAGARPTQGWSGMPSDAFERPLLNNASRPPPDAAKTRSPNGAEVQDEASFRAARRTRSVEFSRDLDLALGELRIRGGPSGGGSSGPMMPQQVSFARASTDRPRSQSAVLRRPPPQVPANDALPGGMRDDLYVSRPVQNLAVPDRELPKIPRKVSPTGAPKARTVRFHEFVEVSQ